MISQILPKRYYDESDLKRLLEGIFGSASDWEIDVSYLLTPLQIDAHVT